MSDSEIVRRLAEKVMGWKVCDCPWHPKFDPIYDIADAFRVVEKMREKIPYQTKTQTFSFQLCQTGIPGKWFCSFVTNSGDWSTQSSIDEADSPARAICLAAIAALEGK